MTLKEYKKVHSQVCIQAERLINLGGVPSDDFVVSRKRDGTELSNYGDEWWDLISYSNSGRAFGLNFRFWIDGKDTLKRLELMNQMRLCMFALMFIRSSGLYSNSILKKYMAIIRKLAQFADLTSLSIWELMTTEGPLHKFLLGLCHSGAKNLLAIMSFYREMSPKPPTFPEVSYSIIEKITKYKNSIEVPVKQTSILPTSIYSQLLANFSKEINDFESHSDRILNLYQECMADPCIGRSEKHQAKTRRELNLSFDGRRPTFDELLVKHSLDDFWSRKDLPMTILGLYTVFTQLMIITSFQIQAYTGMRAGEVNSLPYNCLSEFTHLRDKSKHYIVNGYTTKFNRGRRHLTQWVTSQSGSNAVKLAQKFARSVYEARNVNIHNSDLPLFITAMPKVFKKGNLQAVLEINHHPNLRSRIEPLITEEDLLELEQMEPLRAWRAEPEFNINQPWVFGSHQLRRSLAIYAQRSGLVSLPSLKKQLQHITREMTYYYCKGSVFAQNFVGDDAEHFGTEWQESQALSQYLGYEKNVFNAEEEVMGPHPHWVNQKLRDADGVITVKREETLKQFKKGLQAYKETIIGGCVKVGSCDKSPLDYLQMECLNSACKNLVINKIKLNRVIKVQVGLVEHLKAIDSDSSEYRQELKTLQTLQSAVTTFL